MLLDLLDGRVPYNQNIWVLQALLYYSLCPRMLRLQNSESRVLRKVLPPTESKLLTLLVMVQLPSSLTSSQGVFENHALIFSDDLGGWHKPPRFPGCTFSSDAKEVSCQISVIFMPPNGGLRSLFLGFAI